MSLLCVCVCRSIDAFLSSSARISLNGHKLAVCSNVFGKYKNACKQERFVFVIYSIFSNKAIVTDQLIQKEVKDIALRFFEDV